MSRPRTPLKLLAASGLIAGGLVACRSASDGAAGAAARDDRGPHATPAFLAETDAWHDRRLERLAAPDGWLSLVALAWLQEGPNRVGNAPDAEVSYAGLPEGLVGTLVVDGEKVVFDTVSGVEVEGVPERGLLRTDADGAPTVLRIGDIRFHVIERGGRLAVRMKDAAAPTRTGFAGIERFPVDQDWRVVAELLPADDDATIPIDTVIGTSEDVRVGGRARFSRGGAQVEAVLFDEGESGYTLLFADATSGRQTYPVGRFVAVAPSTDGRTVVLDFNRAYSPPCAFTRFATCPLPPAANRFPFAVDAGERWSGED